MGRGRLAGICCHSRPFSCPRAFACYWSGSAYRFSVTSHMNGRWLVREAIMLSPSFAGESHGQSSQLSAWHFLPDHLKLLNRVIRKTCDWHGLSINETDAKEPAGRAISILNSGLTDEPHFSKRFDANPYRRVLHPSTIGAAPRIASLRGRALRSRNCVQLRRRCMS